MREGVLVHFTPVVPPADDQPLAHGHRSHRNLSQLSRLPRKREGLFHKRGVSARFNRNHRRAYTLTKLTGRPRRYRASGATQCQLHRQLRAARGGAPVRTWGDLGVRGEWALLELSVGKKPVGAGLVATWCQRKSPLSTD